MPSPRRIRTTAWYGLRNALAWLAADDCTGPQRFILAREHCQLY